MNLYMTLFALFGVFLFCYCMYEAFVVPYLTKKAKANVARNITETQKLQRDADDLEQRLKEARERGARMVERDQRRAKPQKPATRTSQERGGVDALQVAADFNDDIPVRSSRNDDTSWISYDSGNSRRDSDSSWGSYSGDSSSSSNYDSGSSSSSCSSSSCD